MNELHHLLSTGLAYRLGWTLLHSLWQGVAVAGLFGLALLVIPARRPNIRYVAGCCSLAALVLVCGISFFLNPPAGTQEESLPTFAPNLLTIAGERSTGNDRASHAVPAPAVLIHDINLSMIGSNESANAAVSVSAAEPWKDHIARAIRPVLPWVAGVWIAGVLGLSVWRLGGCVATYRLRRLGTSPVGKDVAAILEHCCDLLRVSRPVRVLRSVVIRTPAVIGHLRPVILLPVSALTGLSAAQIEAIVAHELAHIRRYDYLVSLIQSIVEILLFHHPAVWWISRRIRIEREYCCDDLVVSIGQGRLVYAEALAKLAPIEARFDAVAAATGGSLLDRIRRLAGSQGDEHAGLSRSAAGVILSALLVLGAAGTATHILAGAGQELNIDPLTAGSAAAGLESGDGSTAPLPAVDDRGMTRTDSKAWYLLGRRNTGLLLMKLPLQLNKVLPPSRRGERVWTGVDGGARCALEIVVQGDPAGEVFVGFFNSAKWDDEPVQVRAFSGPGRHTVTRLPAGEYVIGAMVGTAVDIKALGVHRTWPSPVPIRPNAVAEAQVLVSPEFVDCATTDVMDNARRGFVGDWGTLKASNLLHGRVIGPDNHHIPYVQLHVSEYAPERNSHSFFRTGADARGYYYADGMEWPYRVYAQRVETIPEKFITRYQGLQRNEVLEGPQEVSFRFGAMPQGTASLAGRVTDQDGDPISDFTLWISFRENMDRLSTEEGYGRYTSFRVPFISEDGSYRLDRLPAGKANVWWLDAEMGRYQSHRPAPVTLVQGQTTALDITIQERRVLYGRVLFEDGSPVYVPIPPDDDTRKAGLTFWPADLPMGHGVGNIDRDGFVAVRLEDQDLEQLRAGTARLTIDYPTLEKGTSRGLGEFPFHKLSADRANAGVVKVKRPEPRTRPAGRSADKPALPFVGKTAHDFELLGTDGRTCRLADVKGKPVLLNVFTTWCGPCAQELPHLKEIWKEHAPGGLVVWAVSRKEKPATVESWARREQPPFPVLIDEKGRAVQQFADAEGRVAVPTNVLLDPAHKVVYARQGFNEENLAALRAALAGMDSEEAPEIVKSEPPRRSESATNRRVDAAASQPAGRSTAAAKVTKLYSVAPPAGQAAEALQEAVEDEWEEDLRPQVKAVSFSSQIIVTGTPGQIEWVDEWLVQYRDDESAEQEPPATRPASQDQRPNTTSKSKESRLSAFPEAMRAPHLGWLRASHQFWLDHPSSRYPGPGDWAGAPGPKLTGMVHLPNGEPLAEAEVIICHTMQSASVANDTISYTGPAAWTDDNGRFLLPAPPAEMIWELMVWHERGFAELKSKELDPGNPLTITICPWGRLEIDFRSGTQPASGRPIMMLFHAPCPAYINYDYAGTTDEKGRLVFEQIRPGVLTVFEPSLIPTIPGASRVLRNSNVQVAIKPGETTRIFLGGTGRPVAARIKLPDRLDREKLVSVGRLSLAEPDPPYPAGLDESRKQEWFKTWVNTPEGQAFTNARARCGEFAMSDPARLRIEDVPAGQYRLTISYFEKPPEDKPGDAAGPSPPPPGPIPSFPAKLIGQATRTFTVPPMPAGRSDEPLNLGNLPLDSPPITGTAPSSVGREPNAPATQPAYEATVPAASDPALLELSRMEREAEAGSGPPIRIELALVELGDGFTERKEISPTELFDHAMSVETTLDTLRRRGRVELLSRPQLNLNPFQKAAIQVGMRVPVPSGHREEIGYEAVGTRINIQAEWLSTDKPRRLQVRMKIQQTSLSPKSWTGPEDAQSPKIQRNQSRQLVVLDEGVPTWVLAGKPVEVFGRDTRLLVRLKATAAGTEPQTPDQALREGLAQPESGIALPSKIPALQAAFDKGPAPTPGAGESNKSRTTFLLPSRPASGQLGIDSPELPALPASFRALFSSAELVTLDAVGDRLRFRSAHTELLLGVAGEKLRISWTDGDEHGEKTAGSILIDGTADHGPARIDVQSGRLRFVDPDGTVRYMSARDGKVRVESDGRKQVFEFDSIAYDPAAKEKPELAWGKPVRGLGLGAAASKHVQDLRGPVYIRFRLENRGERAYRFYGGPSSVRDAAFYGWTGGSITVNSLGNGEPLLPARTVPYPAGGINLDPRGRSSGELDLSRYFDFPAGGGVYRVRLELRPHPADDPQGEKSLSVTSGEFLLELSAGETPNAGHPQSASRPVERSTPKAGADWGDPVDGVRCRLVPAPMTLNSNGEPFAPNSAVRFRTETMTFFIDLQSDRERLLPGGPATSSEYELAVDGRWYQFAGVDIRSEGATRARNKRIWLAILPPAWMDPVDGSRLRIPAGKHSIQLAVTVPPDSPAGRPIRVFSNLVHVELISSRNPMVATSIAEDALRWPEYRGLKLKNARVTTGFARLPDLFHEVPPGSRSYELRFEVQVVHQDPLGTVYALPRKGIFYVQCDPIGSSRLHYYGPFTGDPRERMDLPAASQPAGKAAAHGPATRAVGSAGQ